MVHPEDLDLRAPIALLRSATHVVADAGAARANLAFSLPGVTVLALATETMNHDHFYDIVCHKAGRYRGLQGTAVDRPADIGSDFRIDPERLGECWPGCIPDRRRRVSRARRGAPRAAARRGPGRCSPTGGR